MISYLALFVVGYLTRLIHDRVVREHIVQACRDATLDAPLIHLQGDIN